MNFTPIQIQIQILFPPQQIQIQIQILAALHTPTIKMLQEKCATLEKKVEDQENRGCRNNLRLIGPPEKAEGQDLCAFLERWHTPHPACH